MAQFRSFVTTLLFTILLLQMIMKKDNVVEGLEVVDPTDGFVALPLHEFNFDIQRPYNVPVDQRYSYVDGVHRMWVFNTDKPHSPTSNTRPRTELRIQGYDYSSGVWQFEGYGYVQSGTSGVCVMQVFGADAAENHASTLMLRVYDGSLWYYRDSVIVPNIYNRWFRLNVIHDVDAGKVTVFVDGVRVFQTDGRGGDNHYFKCGVYAQNGDSHRMESRWKGIKVFKKM